MPPTDSVVAAAVRKAVHRQWKGKERRCKGSGRSRKISSERAVEGQGKAVHRQWEGKENKQ